MRRNDCKDFYTILKKEAAAERRNLSAAALFASPYQCQSLLQKAGIGLVRRAIDTTGEMHNNTLFLNSL
jgi:hypothetical protein